VLHARFIHDAVRIPFFGAFRIISRIKSRLRGGEEGGERVSGGGDEKRGMRIEKEMFS